MHTLSSDAKPSVPKKEEVVGKDVGPVSLYGGKLPVEGKKGSVADLCLSGILPALVRRGEAAVRGGGGGGKRKGVHIQSK